MTFRAVLARPQENAIQDHMEIGSHLPCLLCLDPLCTYMELFMYTKRAIIDISSSYDFNECTHQNQSWVAKLVVTPFEFQW